jgi:hypothetical protein
MSQTQCPNGTDSRDIQQDNYPPILPYVVLKQAYPSVDPVISAQENNGAVATGPRIVLSCGPDDDDEECGDEYDITNR